MQDEQPEGEQATTEEQAAGVEAEWTVEERRAFRAALDKRRARQVRASQLVAIALVLVVTVSVLFRLPASLWVPLTGAIALGGTVFRLVNWKCPHCGERLRSRHPSAICLGCGAPLE